MNDYSKLQELAESATSGPWVSGGNWVSTSRGNSIADCPRGDEEFIAAANPATVLALLAEIKRLRTAEGDAMTYKAGMENVAQQRDQLKVELEQLAKKIKHSDYWHGTRFETLFHWAHRELNDSQKNQYFSIVANGSSYPDDPPTYAQQMNRLKWKVEAAEKERDMLKAENERLRKLPTCWSEVLEQSEANDQLLDQVLELSRDAGRYRWLRTQNIPLNGHDFLSSHEILDQRVDAKILKGGAQ